MKDYIKAVLTGFFTGITATLLFGIAFGNYPERPLTLGGEFLLPAVIAESVYIGWKSAHAYFFSFPTEENNKNTEEENERISD